MCECVSKVVREGDFSINIYAWQTDQWPLKRSRADDDGCWLYVLIYFDRSNELQMHTHIDGRPNDGD